MLRPALLAVALMTVAASPRAQDHPDGPIGFSVGYGLATPEALAFPTTDDDFSIAFRSPSGVDVAVFGSASSYGYDSQDRSVLPERVTRYRDGVDRRIGVAVGYTVPTSLGEVRIGASGASVYDRDRVTDYEVVEIGDPAGGAGFYDLRLDAASAEQSADQRLYVSAGANLSRTVRLNRTGSFAPGVGVAVGTYHNVDGRTLARPSRGIAYINLPVAIRIGNRLGLRLDATVGVAANIQNDLAVQQFGVSRILYTPETQVTLSALF